MRTDRVVLAALAVAALHAAAPARAQDTLAPAAAAAPAAPAPAGSRIGFNGLSVPRGQVVDGDVVAPFGNVRVDGEVRGDVVVGKGDLVLGEGAVVRGDAVVNGGGKLMNEGGRVLGEMRVNSDDDEVRVSAAPRHARGATDAVRIRHRPSILGTMGRGLTGLISTFALGLVLAALGAGLVFYARPQLERVSQTIRGDTLRSGGIGIAAWFLSIPLFVVGLVVLAVTIVGIPLILLFAPLFWAAAAAAAAYGIVAVAHGLGERTAEQSGSFEPARRNAYTYVFTGVGLLLAPMAAGHLLELTGFLGWLGTFVGLLAKMVFWLAATIGFGAVVLTRAGTREGWPWRRDFDPVFDAPFGETPRGAHV